MNANSKPKIMIGVAESDAHVVANHLIAFMLRERGYEVVNAGACTSVAEFTDLLERHPDTRALLIGSLNGHASQDLEGLRSAKASGQIRCPIIVGGNLSVGSQKSQDTITHIRSLGVDHILKSHLEILPLLQKLILGSKALSARVS